ncbi:MAG: purine-cytosine permease family protein [Acidimicrobiales bacterium]
MATALDVPDMDRTPATELPDADRAFRVEQHGIDFIPLSERWARPRDVGSMWAGASVQIEYFIYGAILMTFGFTFAQAVSLIVIGNLSYFLLGLCSLQGPQTGTTVFAINRAPYGTNGSRGIAFFNWITQIGFEVEGLILIVGAALVLGIKAGFAESAPEKVVFVLLAVLIQGILPFLGHATIVKTLRLLAIPFVVLFAIMLAFALPHATTHGVAHAADWQTYLEGMAFTITLSGLGWAECGNDYSRYCKPDARKRSILLWVFVGTAVPEILIMLLGAAVGTFLTTVGKSANAFLPFAHQGAIPAWFVVVFLCFCIVQLFAINSLDLYSSGVTLQALGVRVKRYVAVVIDCVIALGVTMYAVFDSSFGTYLKDFVDVVIVWIAPWCAIYLVDWVMRRFRYVPADLQRTDRGSLYFGKHGISWPAVIAQLVGMYAAISALSATFRLPVWLNQITFHTRDSAGFGADFSVYLGMGVAGLVYLVLGWSSVRRQAARQDRILADADT